MQRGHQEVAEVVTEKAAVSESKATSDIAANVATERTWNVVNNRPTARSHGEMLLDQIGLLRLETLREGVTEVQPMNHDDASSQQVAMMITSHALITREALDSSTSNASMKSS